MRKFWVCLLTIGALLSAAPAPALATTSSTSSATHTADPEFLCNYFRWLPGCPRT